MLLLVLGLVWCTTSVRAAIPPSYVFYQNTDIPTACVYGNLTVALVGKTLKPSDCNSHISDKDLDRPPSLYINSTNSTERFTVIMVDKGPRVSGRDYLQWMVTNVSINTLPDYQNIPPINVLAPYTQPLLMDGTSQPTLIQILVFRHQNVLRIPFGELWVTRRSSFSLRTLFSNTLPNLRLCGPVAGTQYWVHASNFAPSAPVSPPKPLYQPSYNPPPGQAGYFPQPGQSGYYPPPGQTGFVPTNQQQPHVTYPKKSLGSVFQPLSLLFVPLALLTLLFL